MHSEPRMTDRMEVAAGSATAGADEESAGGFTAEAVEGVATADAAAPPPRGGMLSKPWFWVPILPLIALDLWSKAAVFAFLEDRWPTREAPDRFYTVWDGLITFRFVQYWNTGTVWGLAQDFTEALIALRIAALFVLGWIAWRTAATDRLRLVVLGMIFAGAAGNLWDNLTEVDGGVRDFLLFFARVGDSVKTFPAFNVADSCITVGAITLAILIWRDDSA